MQKKRLRDASRSGRVVNSLAETQAQLLAHVVPHGLAMP